MGKRKRRVGGARDEGGGAGVLERGAGDGSTLAAQRRNSLGAVRAFLCRDSQSRFSSLTPWGKKATIVRSSRASDPSSLNIGDLSDSSMVAESVFLCCVCNRPVRRPSHSLVSRSTPHLFSYGTVASRLIDTGVTYCPVFIVVTTF